MIKNKPYHSIGVLLEGEDGEQEAVEGDTIPL